MFTSDIKKARLRGRVIYIGVTAFVLVFGIIYEIFSHNVYSPFLYLGWLIPLLGLMINEALWACKKAPVLRDLVAGAVAWLTLGSLFKGALDIYGTSNRLIIVFPLVAALQLLVAIPVAYPNLLGRARANS